MNLMKLFSFLLMFVSFVASAETFLTDVQYQVEVRSDDVKIKDGKIRLDHELRRKLANLFKGELKTVFESTFQDEDDVQILPLILDKLETDSPRKGTSTLSLTVPLISPKPLDAASVPVESLYILQANESGESVLARKLPRRLFAPSSYFYSDNLKDFPELQSVIKSNREYYDKRDSLLTLSGLVLVTVTNKSTRALFITEPNIEIGSKAMERFEKLWTKRGLFPLPTVLNLFKAPVVFNDYGYTTSIAKITVRGLSKGFKSIEKAISSSRNLKDLAKYMTDLKDNESGDPDYRRFLEYLLSVPDADRREKLFKEGKELFAASPKEFKSDLNARLLADLGDFEVLKHNMGTGKHSLVSLVRNRITGELWALKRPLDSGQDHASSFDSEIERAKLWLEAGITTIQVMRAPDGISLLKTYVDGPTLRDVLIETPEFLLDKEDPRRAALLRFLKKLAKTDIYFGDLNAKNLIYDGEDWQVIDSGGHTRKDSSKKAAKEYFNKLPLKWRRSVSYRAQDAVAYFFEKEGRKAMGIERSSTSSKGTLLDSCFWYLRLDKDEF